MHKKLLVGACALGIAVPVLAAEKPWFAAGIDTYIDWPTDGTDKVIEEVGTWSNTAVAGLAGDDAKYLAITNAEQALTFTAETAQSLASVDAKFVSEVKYTAFELEDLPEIPVDAKAGLTVAQDSEGNLTWRAIRYNADESANEWVVLTAEGVPATTSATVTVSVKMNATRVSYAVNGASLTDDQGGSDFPLAPGAETLSAASYQGIGEVRSLDGKYEGAPWETDEETGAFVIKTVEDLQNMATYMAQGRYTDKDFQLDGEVGSIDMSDVAWSGIGTEGNPFTGTFNGNCATISGLGGALFAYATDATIKNLTVTDAPFVGTAAGTITFAACTAFVTVETPAYGYAYVLAGADGASVVFDESESPNFGPTMLKPVPEDVALMEKMRYGKDVGGFVQYLIGIDDAVDPIYADLDTNPNVGPYLLLHNVDNSQYTVVDLWEEGQSVAFDTALGADFLAPDPVGIVDGVEGLWIAKSTEGTVTTYSTTTEEPAPEAYPVQILAKDNTTVASIMYNDEQVDELTEATDDDVIVVTFAAAEHYTLSGEATVTITVSEKILDEDGNVVIDGPEATPIVVMSVTLDKTEATLEIEDTLTLTATVAPKDALETTVTWTSDDDSVATVDEDGVVTAVAAGTATITAACGDVSATCMITVNAAEQPLPGEDLVPEEKKEAYKVWADANGVTADTTVAPKVLAVAFLLGAEKGEAFETIEAAAQAKVDTLVPQIDMSKVIAGELTAAVDALNTALAEKGLKASLVPATELKETPDATSGFYKLQISLATEN